MTIPIVPGPFSFLEKFGEAGGRAFAAAEGQRRYDQEYARNQVKDMFEAVQAGTMSASALKSPFFASLVQRSGLTDSWAGSNIRVNPEEQVAQVQSEELSGIQQQQPGSTERRQVAASGKIPSRVQSGTERIQAETLEGGGAAGRAAAGVLSPEVAAVQETAAIGAGVRPEAASIVDEVVGGEPITQQNYNQLLAASVQRYQETYGENAPLPPALAARYFAGALTDRMYRQAEIEIARTAAVARSQSLDPRYLQIAQQLPEQLIRLLGQLPKPSEQDLMLAGLYEAKVQQIATMSPEDQQRELNSTGFQFMRSAYERVQKYNEISAQIQSITAGAAGNVSERLGEGRLPNQPGGTPSSARPNAPTYDVEGAATAIMNGQATMQDLQSHLDNGVITQQQYDQIRFMIEQKRSSR